MASEVDDEPNVLERHSVHASADPACPICALLLHASTDPHRCTHPSFALFAAIGRISSADGSGEVAYFTAEMAVYCAVCAAQFGWRGLPVGMDPRAPRVSPDALELRAPLITPSELELLGPLAAMQPGAGPDGFGFTIRPG